MPLAVCATPIGNLDDVTLRVLEELRAADLVLCEDTRRTRILLDRHGIRRRLSVPRHNEAARTAEILPRLQEGASDRAGHRRRPARRSATRARGCCCGDGRRGSRDGAPRPVGRRDRARRERLGIGRYRFFGYLPRGERALGPLWAELAARGRRRRSHSSRRSGCRATLGVAGGGAARARGRGLPRADESLRGGRPGRRTRSCGPLRRRLQRGDHTRVRAGNLFSGSRIGPGSRLLPSSWAPPASRAVRPRTSRGASPARRGTASIATHSDSSSDLTTRDGRDVLRLRRSQISKQRSDLDGVWRSRSFPSLAWLHPQERPAWSWPTSGDVLEAFSIGNDPYAPGQHRGVA